jgi:hypothetical protein
MQAHLEHLAPVPVEKQIIRACDWLTEAICFDEKILCLCQDIPAKLQNGPQ